MSGASAALKYRFAFDQHVSRPALRQLRARGVDIVHVAEAGLAEADDPDIFLWAMQEGRILVTRNYRDFAPLVHAYASRGETFPGVLFYATSVRESDAGAHVRAVEAWIWSAESTGSNPVQSSFGWLR